MAFVIADRVKETTTTAGNGTVTLLGASAGYQSFAAVGNGNTTYYCIAGQTTSEWEVGIGTYTSSGTTLSRDTVLSSSNSGNKIVFSAGTKDVFVTYPSERAVTTDTTQTLSNKTLGSGSTWNGNAVAVAYGGTGTTTFSNNIIPYFDGSTFNSTNVYFFSNLVGVNISSPGAQLDVQASTGTPLRFATAYADVSAVWGQRVGSSTTEKYRISWDYLNGGFYFYDISNSAERMRIDSSGNVGIGTSTPGALLHVSADAAKIRVGVTASSQYTDIYRDNATGYTIYNAAQASPFRAHVWQLGGTEAARIDSSGNVGIGTSSPTSISGFTSVTVNNATTGGLIDVQCNGATVGRLYANSNVAYLYNQSSNPLVFGTGGLEKMRIDSSGNVLVGTTSASNSGSGTRMQIAYDGGGTQYGLGFRPTTNTTVPIQFGNASGATVGTISQDASNVAYNTSSDYRLKENIVPMTGALAKVSALKPCTYNWKLDGSAGQGFIAHELAEVCPQAVTGKKDAVDENGKPVYQGVDTSFLVATLTAAIQELKAEVDALKAQLAKV